MPFNSHFGPNPLPDSVVLFIASTMTALFMLYREKAFALTSTQHEHQKKGPYIKPPSEYRTKSAAPSIKVVAQGSDAAEMTGRTIEGYFKDLLTYSSYDYTDTALMI